MSIPENSHLKTIWEQHKQRIQNQKVVCTTHTLCKSVVFKDFNCEKKDYYCDTCFNVGKCGTLAVEEAHYYYYITNEQGEERHLYQVKVNSPISRDAKHHILEACIIVAVVAFHELNPNKLIFISIHFHYGFLPSGGKECRNLRPLHLLPDHTNLFIDDKLGHFILQKIYNAASKPPAELQMLLAKMRSMQSIRRGSISSNPTHTNNIHYTPAI